MTLPQYFSAFEWPLALAKDSSLEEKFHDIVQKLVATKRWPVVLRPGALQLLDSLLSPDSAEENNNDATSFSAIQVAILSGLPRATALLLLSCASQLPEVLTGKGLPVSRLVTSDASKASSGMIRACTLLARPLPLIIAIDSSVQNLVAAKRLEMSAIGLIGTATRLDELRAADKVIRSLDTLSIKEIMEVIFQHYRQIKGPDPASASVPDLIKTKLRSVDASPKDKRRGPADTFAEEFGSDMA
jgi:beta-phosphoglucomutase-like phosphatase (HAD superfamily)